MTVRKSLFSTTKSLCTYKSTKLAGTVKNTAFTRVEYELWYFRQSLSLHRVMFRIRVTGKSRDTIQVSDDRKTWNSFFI